MLSDPGDQGPSYKAVLHQAWPAILANAAVPMLGLADTAIIAKVGGDVDLGGVALSSLVFNAIYWALGFLRMSTTALVARALGAGAHAELRQVVARALGMGLVLGAILVVVRAPLSSLCLRALSAGPELSASANRYMSWRMGGAPAVLIFTGVSGALIGLGRTRALLGLQLLMNGVNLACNVALVWGVGGRFHGVEGLAVGTLCAEWVTALVALGIWRSEVAKLQVRFAPSTIASSFWDRAEWIGMLRVNFNLFLRTLALLTGFSWFTRTGTTLGEQILAGNHLLQQLVSFSAFFLDGVAFVVESYVGQAIGAKAPWLFRTAVVRTSVVAFGFACALALAVYLVGPSAIRGLSPSAGVSSVALHHLPQAATYILLGAAAWHLDGIFIGAACGAALRNAAVISLGGFAFLAVWWTRLWGNTGLWWAMNAYIALRGISLAAHWSQLKRSFRDTPRGA